MNKTHESQTSYFTQLFMYIKRGFLLNVHDYVVTCAGLLGAMLVFHLLPTLFGGELWGNEDLAVVGCILWVYGIVLIAKQFKDFHQRDRVLAELSLPVDFSVKVGAALLRTLVFFPILIEFLYFAYRALRFGVDHITIAILNNAFGSAKQMYSWASTDMNWMDISEFPMKEEAGYYVGYFVILASSLLNAATYFLGGAYFRRGAIYKTFLVTVAFGIAVAIAIVNLIEPFMSLFGDSLKDFFAGYENLSAEAIRLHVQHGFIGLGLVMVFISVIFFAIAIRRLYTRESRHAL